MKMGLLPVRRVHVSSTSVLTSPAASAPSFSPISICSHVRFYKMGSRLVPIFFVNPICIPIKIQLVHPKCNQKILGLPLFFVRILVLHSNVPHNAAASWVVSVMRCCDIRQAVLFHLGDHRFARFCDKSLMPEFPAKPISEIVMFLHIHFYVADGMIVRFQADRVSVCLRLDIF